MIKTLKIDRDVCIGAASCVAVYPDVFELDSESKAVFQVKDGGNTSGPIDVTLLDVSAVDDDTLMLAAQSCPTGAIFLYDDSGAQVFPQ